MSVIDMDWQIPRRLSSADPLLLAPVAVLLALSIVMVFSAAIGTHGGIGGGMTVLAKHVFGIVLGLTVGAVAACLPLSLWQRSTRPLFALGAVLLALILIPGVGHEVNGSTRWLSLGLFNFQPSELIKVLTVLFLADHFVRHASAMDSFQVSILIPTAVVGAIGVLLLQE